MNTIGRYQLVEKLGQGGMGVVYRAFDPLLQRVVAVKLIANLEAGDELRERFFREARAAGQLSHKNIITIHDLGDFEGQPFLAMEYLEGHDLQHRMAAQMPMSLSRKLDLAVEICEGVEYAHDHGVIHRDIKPANIFITNSGTVKILDFGLARLITSELTNSNMMMGTLNYMAPEQVRGERADHRSDIFSSGVVLYELFGGRRAFEGDSFGATLYKILEEVPTPLRELDATVPPELEAVVARAMHKMRESRYPHMSEMVRELAAYRNQLIITNSPPLGVSAVDVTRTPSDAPRSAVPGSRPLTPLGQPTSGAGRPRTDAQIAADAPTMESVPTPFPPRESGSVPIAAPGTAAIPPRPNRLPLVALTAAVILVGAVVWWMAGRDTVPPQTTPATSAPAASPNQQEIASRLEQASKALQAGNRAEAQRQADAVLALSPGHPEARRLRDEAQQAIDAANRHLANARDLFAKGRFEEASRAAGEVLAVDPTNTEAQRLMNDATARIEGKGAADEARSRMAAAKTGAAAASAARLASAPYNVALSAEREAASLHKRGRIAEATAKYYEATGLFRSAEVAAETEAAARVERSRAQAEQKQTEQKQEAARATEPPRPLPQPPLPTLPTSTGLPNAPVASPVAPPSAPLPPPRPAPSEPAAEPSAAIAAVLERYESALESRNLDAIRKIWPTLPSSQEAAFRSDFRNARSVEIDIVSPQISVNGNAATAQFVRRYRQQTIDGQRVSSESRTTMSLQKVGQTWTITGIQFVLIK